MNLSNIDWQQILSALQRYSRLPHDARKFFLGHVTPSQAIPNAVLGASREPLLDSGLMVSGVKGVNASVKEEFRDFHKLIRALNRHRISESASRTDFNDYVREHFDDTESVALAGRGSPYGFHYDYESQHALFMRVCSANWVKQFLEAKSVDWEQPFQVRNAPPYLPSADVLNATQWLIRTLVKEGSAVPLARLPELVSPLTLPLLSAAFRAATRYLLAFPSLESSSLEPVLRLWPRLANKLRRPVLQPPEVVAVEQQFSSPILMEDMVSILAACAATPLRVRANDHEFFEANQRELQAAMGPLPPWVDSRFQLEQRRIADARVALLRHGFATVKGDRGRNLSLQVRKAGAQWLELGARDRLKRLLDDYRKPEYSHLLGGYADSLKAAFASLTQDGFVRLSDFLAYHGEVGNPFIGLSGDSVRGRYWTSGGYALEQTAEELEDEWRRMLTDLLRLQLIPLGAVTLGQDKLGSVCFALAPPGKYLFGAAPDFQLSEEAPGHVVVQPNFDIVFLSPSRKAEIDIARFGERLGKNVGTVFKLTKASIQTAAATGLTAERIIEILHQHCNDAVPRNVESEIHGWLRQFRQVSIRPAIVVHCPDVETATRVLAAVGKNAARLSDTVLEWTGEKISPSQQKKLRAMGIFVKD